MHFLNNFSFRHNKRPESVASIIMLDIDSFKKVNDDYRHIEGDQILIKLTQLLKDTIRSTDQVYRYDGEEFIIIANGANTFEATELAEKIRRKLEMSQLSKYTTVTASFGVAELHKSESPTRWIERAEKALLRAKRAGKNRVYIANFDTAVTKLETHGEFKIV